MTNQLTNLAILLGIYLFVPIALAMVLVGANWKQVLIAYGVLLVPLGLIAGGGSTAGEKIGWLLILGMFTAIPGIPLISLVLKILKISA
jgi:hypothetical protein